MIQISKVECESQIYWARYEAQPYEPVSSVTQLIQGVWEQYPDRARTILRNRILTTEEMNPMNWGMIKIGAQRWSPITELILPEQGFELKFDNHFERPQISPEDHHLPPMELAYKLSQISHRQKELYLSDRPVGAVLIDSNGKLLHWSHNTNRRNRCLHAEVNLLQSWWRSKNTPPPKDSQVHVTLEPCRMCAGMLNFCAPFTGVQFDQKA